MPESFTDPTSATAMDAGPALSIQAQFEEEADRTPEATALVCGQRRLTYRDLNAWANRLAGALRAAGAGPGDVVGIGTGRGAAMAAAVLAVVKAGAAYLPLDPGHPMDRLRFALDDAAARLLVYDDGLPDPSSLPLPAVLADDPSLASLSAANLTPPAGAAQSLMYVVSTSGSTGLPKGVAMHQKPQVDLVEWSARHYARRPTVLQYFPLTSDVASYELLTTWRSGGCAVIATEAQRHDVTSLAGLVREHRVTRLTLPVSVLEQLAQYADAHPNHLASVREVATTGDRLLITAPVRRMFDGLPGVFLENQWGSTEVNVVTTVRFTGPADDWPDVPSIGSPIGNARVYLLDAALAPVPPGVPGEIHVGGDPVARGYAGRPGTTAQRFVPDPFSEIPGARMYRTGDLSRWRSDGTLEFLGRTDLQVKISGYRVEPGEIEFVIRDRPDIADAAVVAVGDEDKHLVAFVVPAGAPVETQDLRAQLASRLPTYMVPRRFVVTDTLPLTRTGKVDRRALATAAHQPPQLVTARNETEQVVADVMAEVLGLDRIGVEQNFFDLGGNSLLVMPVIHRLSTRLGMELPLRAVFDAPTAAELAVAVAAADKRTGLVLARRER